MSSAPIPPKVRRMRTGVVPAESMARVFVLFVRITALALIVLSYLGTCYGLAGAGVVGPDGLNVAPATSLMHWGMALILQTVLSLIQWGARAWAHQSGNPVWFVAYAAALGISVTFNWIAYSSLIMGWGVAWWLTLIGIALFDMMPEHILGEW